MEGSQTRFNHSFNVEIKEDKSGLSFGFVVGVALVLIGLGLLLDVFGVLDFYGAFGMWWPSLLMLAAVVQLATGDRKIAGPAFLFLIGALLQANKLDYLPGGFWATFWPIALILIGVSIIGKRWKKKVPADPNHIGTINVEGSRVEKTAIFTGIDTRVNSQDFTGGELTAVFGGIEVDMRDAAITKGKAHIDITAVCGGVELLVPSGWNIVVKGTPIFGGIDDKSVRTPKNPDAPVLVVDATVVFGGIEIH